MSLQITITDAGRAAIVNASQNGTAPVTLSHVGLGTGQYTPSASQTSLRSEIKRIATIAGQVVADDMIHVTIRDEGNDDYSASEFGLYTDSGVLFAVYSQSTPFTHKASASSLLLSVDILVGTINANSITFGDVSFANPPASTTVPGVIEVATLAEVLAGTDTQRAVTPYALAAAIAAKVLEDSNLRAGEVVYFARTTPPSGFIKANGAAVSRSTFANLFSAIGTMYGAGNGSTTFNVPDLRGEFIRGWDDLRGVDSGRGFGSRQDATAVGGYIQSDLSLGASSGTYMDKVLNADGAQTIQGSVFANHVGTTGNTGGVSNVYPLDFSSQTYFKYEVRPRNVALLACIKI